MAGRSSEDDAGGSTAADMPGSSCGSAAANPADVTDPLTGDPGGSVTPHSWTGAQPAGGPARVDRFAEGEAGGAGGAR